MSVSASASKRRASSLGWAVFLVLVCTLGWSSLAPAQVRTVGPGFFPTTQGTTADTTGERTNIADSPASVLTVTPAGTYDVTSFFFGRGATVGEVAPFLAQSTGTNQYQVIWAGAPTSAAGPSTPITGTPESQFTLASDTTLYAGFSTSNGGRVLLVNVAGHGTTDHNATALSLSAGSNISSVTNPDLPRAYRFAVGFQPAATSGRYTIGPGIAARTGADSGDRLNIDQLYGRRLSPGTYTVDNFSYYSSAAAGNVTPFLAVKGENNNEWQILWKGDPTAPTSIGDVSFNLSSSFTLNSEAQVFAGFFTAAGGRVGFDQGASNNFAYGLTDHAGTFTPPNVGELLATFSNPDLGRRYDFSISVVPEPASVGLIAATLAGACLVRRRKRIG